jgi:hypothetical protein
MFEITLGNWMPPCRALVENVDEWWMIFSIGHKLVIGFSVVSVITGIFIQETFKIAKNDEKIMVMDKARSVKAFNKHIGNLFTHTDADGNGLVSKSEFVTIMNNEAVQDWLGSLDLDVRGEENIDLLWSLIGGSSCDEELTFSQLHQGIRSVRGSATSFALGALTKELRDQYEHSNSMMIEAVERLQEQIWSIHSGSKPGLA